MTPATAAAILSDSLATEARILAEGNERMPSCEHKSLTVADIYVRGAQTEFRMRCNDYRCRHVFSVWKDTPDAMRHIRPIGER